MYYLIQRPIAMLGAGVLGLAVLSLLGAHLVEPAYVRTWQAQGYPATLEELNEFYAPVPEEENAALLYMEASARVRELPLVGGGPWGGGGLQGGFGGTAGEEMEDWERPHEPLPFVGQGRIPDDLADFPEELRARLREYLALNAESLALVHQAVDLPGVRFPIDLREGSEVHLKHLAPTRHLSRVVSLEVLGNALEEDSAAATRSLLTHLRLGEALAPEPLLISQLVRVAMSGIAWGVLELGLNHVAFEAAELEALQAALQRRGDPVADMERAMVAERVLPISREGWYLFEQDARGYAARAELGDLRFWATGLARRFGMGYAIERSALLQGYRGLSAAAAEFQDYEAWEKPLDGLPPGEWQEVGTLAQLLIPAQTRIWAASLRAEAQMRLAETAVAIERYRLAEGRIPETLEALTPTYLEAVPRDPFGPDTLQYRREGQDYLLYSFGDNRQDGGGVERWQDAEAWDVVFRVGIPAPEREVE